MTRGETLYAHWVIKHRWWIITATVLLMALCASGARFLTVDNDTRMFFGSHSPELQALEALEGTYDRVQNLFYVIAPADGHVFTRPTLRAIAELTEAAWQIPYSRRVDSVTNFQHARVQQDEIVVAPLLSDVNDLSNASLDEKRQIALSEPALLNFLISPSGHVTGINISLTLPGKSREEVPQAATYARRLAERFRREHPDLSLYLTGGIMMDTAYGEAGEKALTTLVPIMFVTLTILVALTLRSFYGSLATLTVVLFSMLTALGLAGWLGISLNAASAGAPTLVLTLAVADSVHILATLFHLMQIGRTRHEAIVESIQVNLQAISLTSITTVIGFLTMNFSESPPFRDLGNITAMGVTAAYVYAVLLLPALLAVLPLRTTRATVHGTRACRHLAQFVIARRTPVFAGMLILVLVLSAGVLRIKVDDNFLDYFDDTFDFRRATDFVLENLSGWDIIEYSLNSGEPGGISNPEYLATVEAFAQWHRRHPKAVYVRALSDVMKGLNRAMHENDERYHCLPDRRDLAAQYLLLYELSLPFGNDLNNTIDVAKSASRMTVLFKSLSIAEVQEIDKTAQAWLRSNAPDHMFTPGTGLSLIWAHITEGCIRRMLLAATVALVLISGLLMIALRSVRLGILSLAPNLVPPLMAFGVWGLLVGQVGLALSVIVSMTIGIVVDDTVHFLSKYTHARRRLGLSPEDAVRYAFETVGVAMWITTVVLVMGFLVLALSHYRMVSEMGLMCALTVTLALVMDLFLLPTLLLTIEGRTGKLMGQGAGERTRRTDVIETGHDA